MMPNSGDNPFGLKHEKQYLYDYHKEVYSKLKNYLNFKEKVWLKNLF